MNNALERVSGGGRGGWVKCVCRVRVCVCGGCVRACVRACFECRVCLWGVGGACCGHCLAVKTGASGA
jgi:hypothetical protein